MKRYLYLLGFALGTCSGAAVAQRSEGIRFEVPVLPEAVRHIELLTAPSYLALALENNGMRPSLSSRLVIRGRESFQIKAGVIRYVGRKGPVFNYEAGINLSFGVGESNISVPVEVDTSTLERGTIAVHVFPPLAKVFPRVLIESIEFKIQSLAGLHSQRKIVEYLDRIAREHKDKKRGLEDMLEVISFDAYNRSSGSVLAGTGSDQGGAKPLTGQVVLLVTLAIWFTGFPLFLLLIRMRRSGKRSA